MADIQSKILAQLKAGQLMNSEMLKELLDDFSFVSANLKKKYNQFKADELLIQSREFDDATKVNNKINDDYRGTIVLQSMGYVFGKPISYEIDKKAYTDATFKALNLKLSEFNAMNNLADLDSETGKLQAICGKAYRLCYIDTEGFEKIININPWEIIALKNNKSNIEYAFYIYNTFNVEGKEVTNVEFYDNAKFVTYSNNGESDFVILEEKAHQFAYMPIIEFLNNSEEQGDCDKVENLIDSYDRIVSDSQNELEEFRLAYMKFTGCEIDEATKLQAKNTGAFSLPEGGDAGFITKKINDTFLENHKKTLNENIYKFSSSVDMSDETFSGASMSGESRKWKLLVLEFKAITKERKFNVGLREMFKVICSAWNTKGVPLNYLDLFFTFKRSIPVDLSYLGDVATKFKGIVSDRTIFSLLPFVEDVPYEMDTIAEEQGTTNVDLDKVDKKVVDTDVPK